MLPGQVSAKTVQLIIPKLTNQLLKPEVEQNNATAVFFFPHAKLFKLYNSEIATSNHSKAL